MLVFDSRARRNSNDFSISLSADTLPAVSFSRYSGLTVRVCVVVVLPVSKPVSPSLWLRLRCYWRRCDDSAGRPMYHPSRACDHLPTFNRLLRSFTPIPCPTATSNTYASSSSELAGDSARKVGFSSSGRGVFNRRRILSSRPGAWRTIRNLRTATDIRR